MENNASKLNKMGKLKPLILPILICTLLGIGYHFASPFFVHLGTNLAEKTKTILAYFVGIALWISVAWLVARLIDIFLWEIFVESRLNIKVPRLIKEIIHFIIYFSAILGITTFLFQQSPLGLLAASGALGIVLGLSLQNLISDLFDGIALNFDRPFEIGEFVLLNDKILNIVVQVVEIAWRSTYFQTTNNELLIIPNSVVSNMYITNLSKSKYSQFKFKVMLDGTIPVKRVMQILEAAVISTPGILEKQKPKINLEGIDSGGIVYAISYWMDVKKVSIGKLKDLLAKSILHNLHTAQIDFFIPKVLSYNIELTSDSEHSEKNIHHFIENIDLFHLLSDKEIAHLVEHSKKIQLDANQKIIEIDSIGDSMFIVVEGLLQTFIRIPNQEKLTPIAHLITGQVLGEMSLLTGAKRSATVIARTPVTLIEITKETLAPILKKNPALIEKIGKLVAEREFQTSQKTYEVGQEELAEKMLAEASHSLIGRIKKYFNF